MRRAVSILLRLAVAGACLAYAVTGVDLGLVGRAMLDLPADFLALVLGVSVLFFLFSGLRLASLVRHGVTPLAGTVASLIGFGLNTVLPARLGEVAKAVYLSRKRGVPSCGAAGAIVAERLLDVASLLALAGLCAGMGGVVAGAWVLALLALAAVVFVVLCAHRPALLSRLTALVPFTRVRGFLDDTIRALGEFANPGRLALPVLYTLCIWGCSVAHVFLVLNGLMGLGLAPEQIFLVFVTITLGGTIPAAPGGLGVFEGAVVVSLGWYGVDKSTALAVALTYRIVVTLLPTLAALALTALSGLRLNLRDKGDSFHRLASADACSKEDGP